MRGLWLVIWLCLPAVALGQVVPVQTGEHARFTRVVVTIPNESDWQLGRNDDGYLLRVPGVEGFDLRGFYDIIPRDRITDVAAMQDDAALQLFVTCQCYVDAFLENDRILVIDVRSGIAPIDAAFEDPIVSAPAETAQLGPAIADRLPLPGQGIFPIIFDPPEETPVLVVPMDPVVDPEPQPQEQPSAPSRADDLAAVERSIAQSLARGLSEGLLEPELALTQDQAALDTLRDLLPPGVTARTGVDTAAVPPDPEVLFTQEGQVCPPNRFFSVADWGDDRPFHVQMGEARQKLSGEFDRIEETDVLDQARLFVYFGFGREAVLTLALDGKASQERRYLAGIANIIDGDTVPERLFEQQVSCVADVALWAFLATGADRLDGKADSAAILRSFKALPTWLQVHLGPRLSEQFLRIGDNESALQALATSVAQPEPSVDAALVETDLLQELGEGDLATSNLQALSRDDPRTTPEVMSAFLTAAVEEGFSLTSDDFVLADALRFQSGLTPQAAQLGNAQARAYLATDQFTEARALISELRPVVPAEQHDELHTEWKTAVTMRGSDNAFLQLSFEDDLESLPISLATLMADRLLTMGFPERALDLLALTGDDDPPSYQQAEALLMLGDVDAALLIVSEDRSDRADALRDAADQVAEGASFDRESYLEMDPTIAAWQSEAWTSLAQSTDDILREVSAEVLTPLPPELDPTAPLADGRALVDQSEQSRDVVDRLLARFPVSADQ